MKPLALLASAALFGCAAAGAAEAPPGPHVYALVSAVGSKISFVRLKTQVGSHLDPYQRFNLDVPGAAIDGAVLRGLETAIRQEDPDAAFVYMKLNPAELEGVFAYERGEVAIAKLAAHFDGIAERSSWHRIVVVTPRYVNSERAGLGAKLHGVGVYVRPIGRGVPGTIDDNIQSLEPDTVSPEGAPGRSRRFIAPYFYAQVWVLDARTLAVLETRSRYDFQRLYDPKSTSIDIEVSIPPEKLAPVMERFVEQSSARAMRETFGTVSVREKPLQGAAPAAR